MPLVEVSIAHSVEDKWRIGAFPHALWIVVVVETECFDAVPLVVFQFFFCLFHCVFGVLQSFDEMI